jgi:DNA invertase Pin-like site-specific DNA recombinase
MFLRMLMVFAEYEHDLTVERINDTIGCYKQKLKDKGKFIARDGTTKYALGRPKGKKDSKPRSKSGYYQRWLENKKSSLEKTGIKLD